MLYALIAGAVSAFAFEPVAFWPLLPVAFAALCELLDREKRLWRSVLLGWVFGVEFVIAPTIRFEGEPGEQATMFLRDPAGNALEFKAMANPANLFAKN